MSNDVRIGTTGADILLGDDGQDTLRGLAGDDILDASGGTAESQLFGDLIFPGLGSDTIIGHEELFLSGQGIDLSYKDLDILAGLAGVDIRVGDNGSGTATGVGINDTFTFAHFFEGSPGDDTIVGSRDFAFEGLIGGDGADILDGRDGLNVLLYIDEEGTGGIDADLSTGIIIDTFGNQDSVAGVFELRATEQEDRVTAENTNSSLFIRTYAGDDTITGSSASDFIEAGADRDSVDAGDGNDVVVGGDDADTLFGGAGNDTLTGESGNDSIDGGTNNDEVLGGAGNDTVMGGDQDDMVFGGDNNDLVIGGKGQDTVDGGNGADRLFGNTGFDRLFGMSGEDYLSGFTGADYLAGGRGADTVFGGSGNDEVYGNTGFDDVRGGIGADYVSGGAGSDLIFGNTGLDTLIGGSGLDTISGGQGSDLIDGGVGSDILRGGGDRDTFVFRAGYNRDVVKDFEDDVDTIRFRDDLWSGNLSAGQVINAFASVRGNSTVFDFGSDELTLEGFTNLAALANDIDIV